MSLPLAGRSCIHLSRSWLFADSISYYRRRFICLLSRSAIQVAKSDVEFSTIIMAQVRKQREVTPKGETTIQVIYHSAGKFTIHLPGNLHYRLFQLWPYIMPVQETGNKM